MPVLLLSGVEELIFFMAADMEAWLGFVLGTGLIIQGCLSCCSAGLTQNRVFCSSCHSTSKAGWGYTENWEGKQVGQLIPNIKLGEHIWSGAGWKRDFSLVRMKRPK